MDSIYLEDHPPARPQFRTSRKALPSGAIVVHTAESTADRWPPDGGAEGVARFIRGRSNPGSYHELVDSDSHVQLGRYEWQMYGEGTGGNRWALHLSFACSADQWSTLPKGWVQQAVYRGGRRARAMADWAKSTHGIIIPGHRITKAGYWAQEPGFITHGEVDPGRRHDPGVDFPWDILWQGFDHGQDSDNQATSEDGEVRILTLDEATREVSMLYLAHRGGPPTREESLAWRKDLAVKIYEKGEDPRPTLAYINHALSNEGGSL